jgi:hypothetical protein
VSRLHHLPNHPDQAFATRAQTHSSLEVLVYKAGLSKVAKVSD